jgi:hypothetical protein
MQEENLLKYFKIFSSVVTNRNCISCSNSATKKKFDNLVRESTTFKRKKGDEKNFHDFLTFSYFLRFSFLLRAFWPYSQCYTSDMINNCENVFSSPYENSLLNSKSTILNEGFHVVSIFIKCTYSFTILNSIWKFSFLWTLAGGIYVPWELIF